LAHIASLNAIGIAECRITTTACTSSAPAAAASRIARM
jgi:hypothetical protein